MLFSLIIPTYNERQYIEPCLQSILHQSFSRSEFQIIVADSQSSDGTAEVAARLADKVVTIPRKGIAHARNAGAKEAAGDILVFVDADVSLHPDFLNQIARRWSPCPPNKKLFFGRRACPPNKKLFFGRRACPSRTVGTFRRAPHADLTPQVASIFPHGEMESTSPKSLTAGGLHLSRQGEVVAVSGKAIPADGTWFPRFVYHATYALVGFFKAFGLPLFPGLCVAYRRQAFDEVGGFREDFGISEDLDLSRRISKLGRCEYERRARAFVSTRRLERHAVSTVLFHIYHDLRYLFFGKTARQYPKSEELKRATDLWRMNRS